MKPTILRTDEVQRLARDGVVTVRRPVKVKGFYFIANGAPGIPKGSYCVDEDYGRTTHVYGVEAFIKKHCPLGSVGEERWVRETWAESVDGHGKAGVVFKADGWHHFDGRWRPSIRMPRWDSRFTVTTESVRVQRVGEITEEEAKAEGAEKQVIPDLGQTWKSYKAGFEYYWDSLYAKQGYGWDTNCWTWVVELRRMK